MADFTVISKANPSGESARIADHDRPQRADLDRCVHCGLCLQACPTYRELGLEMDSPRGRIYQMAQVENGAPITDSYREHIDLCLACRACETACPSGVEYGRLIEAARCDIEAHTQRPPAVRAFRWFVFNRLLCSPPLLTLAGSALWVYQASGLQKLVRASGILRVMRLAELESLAPRAEPPFFFRHIGKTFPAVGEKRYRVAFLAGCIANVSFARLNEATLRVLQRNGCEVVIAKGQTCCGALHVHSGVRKTARQLARQNVDAIFPKRSGVDAAGQGFDAIISNAAGCGSTLKEYDELLEHEPEYADRARAFVAKMRDVSEFLASIPLNPRMGKVVQRATYQDSCHLAHGQKITGAPRELLAQVPGLEFREMPNASLCCGSAGIYNVLHTDMAMRILREKMGYVNSVRPSWIVTANPGCMLQLEAGARLYGKGERVLHVVEVLDEAYRAFTEE